MDEDQLKEKRELDALDLNQSMNRTNDVNTIGSALDFQTEKSIELEYKNMPELPIQ
jgi:hypothetical protein